MEDRLKSTINSLKNGTRNQIKIFFDLLNEKILDLTKNNENQVERIQKSAAENVDSVGIKLNQSVRNFDELNRSINAIQSNHFLNNLELKKFL